MDLPRPAAAEREVDHLTTPVLVRGACVDHAGEDGRDVARTAAS